jgi:hypothetical protein
MGKEPVAPLREPPVRAVENVLIEARSKLGRNGLLLAAPQHETRRALQVSGLDRHLPVHDTVDAALVA